jgi:hypothetical protein
MPQNTQVSVPTDMWLVLSVFAQEPLLRVDWDAFFGDLMHKAL